jgi:hypothetical protein
MSASWTMANRAFESGSSSAVPKSHLAKDPHQIPIVRLSRDGWSNSVERAGPTKQGVEGLSQALVELSARKSPVNAERLCMGNGFWHKDRNVNFIDQDHSGHVFSDPV